MSAQNAKSLSSTIPFVVAFLLVKEASGTAQVVAIVFVGLATVGSIHVAADLLWAPLFRKYGLWRNSLLLGCSLVAVAIAAYLGGLISGAFPGMGRVFVSSAVLGLLYSWMLAAMRAAQDGKAPAPSFGGAPIRSLLTRGRWRAPQ